MEEGFTPENLEFLIEKIAHVEDLFAMIDSAAAEDSARLHFQMAATALKQSRVWLNLARMAQVRALAAR